MKTNRLLIGIAMVCLLGVSVQVQAVSRAARQEAMRLSREGWRAFPDAQSLAEQIEQTKNVQYDAEGKLSHKYIIGEGTSSVCPSLEEAEAQANAMARINLLGQCDVECKALLTSTSMQNDDVTEAHVENASVDVIASKNQFFGYTVKSTYAYDNVSAAHIRSIEMYYNDELLMRNYETETNVESEINWEAVTKYGSVVPYAQNAWRITRMYRKVRGGYEALIRVCNYAYTTEKSEDVWQR